MEGVSVDAVASSDVYRFIVGPERAVYFVHSALLAYHSPALDAMVRSGLREAVEQTVKWEDIDRNAFLGLWQFLYTGKYNSPVIRTLANEKEDLEQMTSEGWKKSSQKEHPQSKRDGQSHGQMERDEQRKCKKRRITGDGQRYAKLALGAEFASFLVTNPEPLSPISPGAGRSRIAVDSYADFLIQHAKVYILADRYIFSQLQSTVLSKLHADLNDCRHDRARTQDAVGLLRYCFENPAPSKLRQLVSLFAACSTDVLWESEGFGELLETCGELSKAILGAILQKED